MEDKVAAYVQVVALQWASGSNEGGSTRMRPVYASVLRCSRLEADIKHLLNKNSLHSPQKFGLECHFSHTAGKVDDDDNHDTKKERTTTKTKTITIRNNTASSGSISGKDSDRPLPPPHEPIVC